MAGGPPPDSFGGPGPPMNQPYADPELGQYGGGAPQGQLMDPGRPFSGDYGGGPTMAQYGYDTGMGGPPPQDNSLHDIGPFHRPILNKVVRVLSALTSLVALVLQFAVLGQ